MLFLCKGCGRVLIIAGDEVAIGRFSGIASFTVPEHKSRVRRCDWSGRIQVEGVEQLPEGKKQGGV